jgi:hypothetical protein
MFCRCRILRWAAAASANGKIVSMRGCTLPAFQSVRTAFFAEDRAFAPQAAEVHAAARQRLPGAALTGGVPDQAICARPVPIPGRNEECIEPVPAAARVSGSAGAWRQDRPYLREPPDSAGGGFRCRA